MNNTDKPTKTKGLKRGPKLLGDKPRKPTLLTVDDTDAQLLIEIGAGNKSQGLHLLCEFYKAHKNVM